jgi:hypothetical protein
MLIAQWYLKIGEVGGTDQEMQHALGLRYGNAGISDGLRKAGILITTRWRRQTTACNRWAAVHVHRKHYDPTVHNKKHSDYGNPHNLPRDPDPQGELF